MNRHIKLFISKTLITIIITLILLIAMKANNSFKKNFYKKVFDNNLSFTTISNFYNKYFGSIIEIPTYQDKTVFNEKISFKKKEKYLDGVKLTVNKNYLVAVQESGMVVFLGNKENYGNVVIIQQVNGIDMWYGNVNNVNVKLYDYVEKGYLLGEAEDYLYLVYKKDGNILNYEDYL